MFSSRREKYLWLGALLVLLAIALSLLFAGQLDSKLLDSEIAGGLFGLAFVLLLIAIATRGLVTVPRRAEMLLLLCVVAAYVLVLTRVSMPVERTHLLEYGLLALLVYSALEERQRHRGSVRLPGLLAITATATIGIADEAIQLLLPNRVFDPRDMLFNFLAAIMAVVSSWSMQSVRRWIPLGGKRR